MLEPLHQSAIGMQHEVGAELAGRRFGLHALDQLSARRADHLDADEGKLLAELVDDLLLNFREGRRVEGELAFFLRRINEAVGGLVRRCGAQPPDDRKAADAGRRCEKLAAGYSLSSHALLPDPPPRAGRKNKITAGSRKSYSTRPATRAAASRTRLISAPRLSRHWDRSL